MGAVFRTSSGEGAGKALDRWVCRWIRWLTLSCIACVVLQNIYLSNLAARVISVFSILLLVVPWALCLRTSVVKSLLREAGVIYYLLSISVEITMLMMIYGPVFWRVDRDVEARAFVFCLEKAATGVGLISVLALGDAAPSRIAPRRMRLFLFFVMAVYKSGL